jgi:uncharacterized protein (TIGR02118 family)
MVKLIGLLKKKAGLTRQEFIDYYENTHAPLARRTLPMGEDYRRSYPQTVRVEGREVEGEPEFDVIAEVWFRDQTAYEAFSRAILDPQKRAVIVADEERFLDRSASRIMIVEEHRSPID